MQITVDIPDRFIPYIVREGEDLARLLLEGAVAGAYRDHRLTMEQVRQLLGYDTRMQVNAFLSQHEISDYTTEDLDQDIATHHRLFPQKDRQPAA